MQENKEERIMKQIKLEINIEACHYDELTEKDRKLIDAACEATKRSYAPYSHFAVGAAALLENDIVITGTIAARTENGFLDTPIPPCGACRQVLLETEKRYGKPMRILLYSKTDIYILENVSGLLPLSFDGNYLK